MELEAKRNAPTIVRRYIPGSRGVDQNIPRVEKTRQHLGRKLANTLKRVEDITDIRDKSEWVGCTGREPGMNCD